MNFAEFRPWFDERFSDLVDQKITQFAAHSDSVEVADIASYAAIIARNGKRFRPFLAYMASGLDQQDAEAHFNLFAAIELIHVFALIHDDIMDQADTRHGVVCAHKKFSAQYGDMTSQGIGILLGDLVFAWAYECLLEYCTVFPLKQGRIVQEFTRLISEVTHGQLLDILSPVQDLRSPEQIIQKMTLKTARYSFVQPLRLGFVIKGNDVHDQAFAESFGVPLGIAFQLQDDLLDILPTEETGKSRFTDIQTGQQTLLTEYIYRTSYAQEFKTFVGRVLNEQEARSLQELIVQSGAIEYVQKTVEGYVLKAQNAVTTHRTADAQMWDSLITLIQERKK